VVHLPVGQLENNFLKGMDAEKISRAMAITGANDAALR
jgi:hypothetical protein